MYLAELFLLGLELLVGHARAAPAVMEVRSLPIEVTSGARGELEGCNPPRPLLMHLTNREIVVGEEGGLPEVAHDRAETVAMLDAFKRARPERMLLLMFVEDDVPEERVVVFVDGARGLDLTPYFVLAPGNTAREAFARMGDWGAREGRVW